MDNSDSRQTASGCNVIHLRPKQVRGRQPLFVSHLQGRVSGSPHLREPGTTDYGDSLHRIRSSLEKINKLMVELKKMSEHERSDQERTSDNREKSR